MTTPTVVLNLVALSHSLLQSRAPNLQKYIDRYGARELVPVLPAVTSTVQSSMLTGLPPSKHGVVGNGWYERSLDEVRFWKQSNAIVEGKKVWDDLSVGGGITANLFWWFNMNTSADMTVTPRPMYVEDGRKIPDIHTKPAELRQELQGQLGQFPLFSFWGPASSIRSSQWIADAAKTIFAAKRPDLMLVYLPHLDYALQQFGPDDPRAHHAVSEIDEVFGDLLTFFEDAKAQVICVNEYGIEPVHTAVAPNQILRHEGLLSIRDELSGERLDTSLSQAFAVADHQVAHVYTTNDRVLDRCKSIFTNTPGIAEVLDRTGQEKVGLNHARSGDLVLISDPGFWFTYDYWIKNSDAPGFARQVDIHSKPGYDPRELFLDPAIRFPKLKVGMHLLKQRLGLRSTLRVIPLDTSLVKGSHGRIDQEEGRRPLIITPHQTGSDSKRVPCTDVRQIILDHCAVSS